MSLHEAPRHPFRTLLAAVAAALLLLLLVSGLRVYGDLNLARERAALLDSRIRQARANSAALERRIEALESDPTALERLAREELGMTYPDEVVIVLPEDASPPVAPDEPTLPPPSKP